MKKLSLLLFLLLILPSSLLAQDGEDGSFPLPDLEVISVENAERVTNLGTLEGFTDWVLHAAFSADSTLIAATGFEDALRIWDVRSGELLASVECPEALDNFWMGGVMFVPNSSLVVTTCDDRIVFWDTSLVLSQEDVSSVRILQLSDIFPYDIAVDPEGRFIAVWDALSKIWLGDIETGTEIFSLDEEGVCCINFSPDGQYFVYSDETETHLLDLETLDEVETMPRSEVFSADWTLSADIDTGEYEGYSRTTVIRLWQGSNDDTPEILLDNFDTHIPSVLSFNPDGTLLASGSGYSDILLWDTITYELLTDIDTCGISSMTFSPDGKLIVTTHADAGSACSLGIILWGVPVND